LKINDEVVSNYMKNDSASTTGEYSRANSSFQSIPLFLLNKFAEKICRFFFQGKTQIAIEDSLRSANAKHELVLSLIDHAESEDNG
jgi:hypothetical protein